MKYYFLFILIYATSILKGQVPEANELVKIHEVTTTEMNSISSPAFGSLIFNTAREAYSHSVWKIPSLSVRS